VSFIKGRLRRLEEHRRSGRCPECELPPDRPGRIALIDDGTPGEGFPDDPEERCDRCSRRLWCVIEIVYDSSEDSRLVAKGGGGA
jgi:hypothetical protein